MDVERQARGTFQRGFVAHSSALGTKPRSSICNKLTITCATSSERSLLGFTDLRAGRPAFAPNSVWISLGSTCVTRTFAVRSSARQHSVSALNANFDAQYDDPSATPRRA